MLILLRETYGEENNYHALTSWLRQSYFSPKATVSLKRENGTVNLSEFFESIFQACEMKCLSGVDVKKAIPSKDGNYKYIAKGNGIVEIYPDVKLMKEKFIQIPPGIGGCNKYIICAGAFKHFTNLKTLTFAKEIESIEIGDKAFSSSGIKTLIIPGNVKDFKLGVGVFYDTNFEKLEISDQVQNIEIGKVRFKDYKLDTIIVPKNVAEFSIPKLAFYNINLPGTLTIPGNTSQSLMIEEYAFEQKTLDRSLIDNEVDNIRKKIIRNIVKDLLGHEFTGSLSELKVIVKHYDVVQYLIDDLESNGQEMLSGDRVSANSRLEEVLWGRCFDSLFSEGYTGSIDDLKVLAKHYPELQPLLEDYLKKLDSRPLTLNICGFSNVTFGFHAFRDSNIDALRVSEDTQSLIINADAFGESKIKDFVIPSSVTKLKLSDYSHIKGSESKKLMLPPNVESLVIGFNVFNGSTDKVIIPDHVKTLELSGMHLLNGISLKKFDLGTVENLIIASSPFANFTVEEFIIPKTVKSLKIDNSTFWQSNIKTLTIMPKLEAENIADNAFVNGTIEKIIVHDEDSRKLLEENRAQYGIADTVQIELAPTTTRA